jgi:hypothetical protein
MADERRDPSDIAFAREMGEKYGPMIDGPMHQVPRSEPVVGNLLRGLVREIEENLRSSKHEGFTAPFVHLGPSAALDLAVQIESALRLLALWREIKLDGVLVSMDNRQSEFNVPALFDVFNPLARRMLTGHQNGSDPIRSAHDFNSLKQWTQDKAAQINNRVAIVPSAVASKGFVTRFVDSLRSTVKSRQTATTSYVDYTVDCRASGYQLEYYPIYNNSPVVFGQKLTRPVSQTVLIGSYYFQGWFNGQLTEDGGTYVAAPNSRAATLRAF